jgi:hypothetical protein
MIITDSSEGVYVRNLSHFGADSEERSRCLVSWTKVGSLNPSAKVNKKRYAADIERIRRLRVEHVAGVSLAERKRVILANLP